MKKITDIFKIDIESNRIFGLDILRAFAIVSVVAVHGSSILSAGIEKVTMQLLPDGVSVFFVLSGFLIGGILIKILEGEKVTVKTLIHFWKRRWLRTLPLYFIILIILIFLSYLFIENFNIQQTFPFFIFCQNLFKSDINFFLVSWSLSVEEWFYLVIPVLLFILVGILSLKPKYAIVFTAVVFILAIIGFRYYRYSNLQISNAADFSKMFRNVVIIRLDSIMFGLAGAWLQFYYRASWFNYKKALFIIGLMGHISIKILSFFFYSHSAFYFCNIAFVLESLSTLALLPYLSQLAPVKGLFNYVITFISLISYSIYLIHAQIVLDWILRFHYLPFISNQVFIVFKYGMFWSITIILSILSYKYIELPFMKMRKSEG